MYFTRDMKNHHGGIVLVDGYLYGFNDSILTCLEFATGKLMWRDRSVGKGSVTFADGSLYLQGENNVVGLAEATPSGYREKGRFRIPDKGLPSWAHPVDQRWPPLRAQSGHAARRTTSRLARRPDPCRCSVLHTLPAQLPTGCASINDVKEGRLRGASRADLSYPLYEFLDSLVPLQAFAIVVIDEAQNLPLPLLLEEIQITFRLERREKLTSGRPRGPTRGLNSRI